mmetsp:Transcript_51025/g.120864  ORF Transcript_51025/g.120864 Transcript_51025/m.120864 type:complete len:254 (+) Transcript_51025:13-774(+)|eukprot:1847704-Rhodomonas_salina.2
MARSSTAIRKPEGVLRSVTLAGVMVASLFFLVLVAHLIGPSSGAVELLAKSKQGMKQQQLSSTQQPESWTAQDWDTAGTVVVQQNSGNMQHTPTAPTARKGLKMPSLSTQQPESSTGLTPQGRPVVVQQNSGNLQHTPYGAKRSVRRPSLSSPQLYSYPQAPESWTIQDPTDSTQTRINQHSSGNFISSLPPYPPQSARFGQGIDLLVPVDMPALNQQEPESYVVYGSTGYEQVNQQNSGNYIPHAPEVIYGP